MIVTSCQKRVMITRNQLPVVMWSPCPWSHPTGKECNVITKRIAIVLGHFVNRTVLHLTRCIEMINHIYSCQIIAANGVVLRMWISVPPSCIAVDSSDRLFHDLSRNHAGHQRVHNYQLEVWLCAKPVEMWNRLEQTALSCHQNNSSKIMYKYELSRSWQRRRYQSGIVPNRNENLFVSNDV